MSPLCDIIAPNNIQGNKAARMVTKTVPTLFIRFWAVDDIFNTQFKPENIECLHHKMITPESM